MAKIKYKAFSLIELMVVIAIVALLAAIAVPTYNKYILKGNMNQISTYLDGIVNSMSVHFNGSGSFPVDLEEMGYVTYSPAIVDGPIDHIFLQTAESIDSFTCKAGGVSIYFAGINGEITGVPDLFGGPQASGYGFGGVMQVYLFENSQGIINRFCTYQLFDDSVSNAITDEVIEGCNNQSNTNFGTYVTQFMTSVNSC